ncbi:hypothetical protein GR160_07845 [Flavobacterium sp. Sd200]|uniref:MauE/DoxX family redox-associated membrane protein n=1 Tax=Flavobacterium sp. Sd200 TaxID=2692211 RepID=UPI00136F4C1B|nr:MauE/DoxX family redox-associated membrane protein [Flavobacterium sp. Sd200]MXN91141.1 hypothetical protein [Flavobacterium sp. Sd200]
MMENIIRKKQPQQLSYKANERLVFIITLIGIFLFLYTAYSKIANYQSFKNGLSKLPILEDYTGFLAWLIPGSEIIIAVLMLIPKTTKTGLCAFTALLIVFTSYLIALLLSGTKLPCSCGGVIQSLNWSQHLWFNLGFIALGLTAIYLSRIKK